MDSNENKGWIPRHKDPPTIDHTKIYSVSEASRLHKAKNITVKGVISGIQPMRKMIKGLSRRCMNCNTIFERIYDKPAFFESFVPQQYNPPIFLLYFFDLQLAPCFHLRQQVVRVLFPL